MEIYLWLDRFDFDMVQIGQPCKSKILRGKYDCWGQIHIDGIERAFGKEVATALDQMRCESADKSPLRVVGTVQVEQ